MFRHLLRYAGVFGAGWIIILQGCAPVPKHGPGRDLIEAGRYAEAVRPLKRAIAQDYRDIEAIRDMGIAMYHTRKLNLAQGFLRLALSRHPDDLIATCYLGMVYEERGQRDAAIQQYLTYVEKGPRNKQRGLIAGRLQVLMRQRMAAEVKALIAQETALDVSQTPENSIAVLYFANLSQNPDYTVLQKGLTDMIITDLAKVSGLTVVERARLQMLIDEIGLGMSGLVAEETAPRMGKLLGAARVVQGTFSGATGDDIRINAGITQTREGIFLPADHISGTIQAFYQLEKDVVFNIIDAMGIQLSRAEREAIQKIPTANLLAFMAYCRGLDYEDKGLYGEARDAFQSAANIDPGFAAAMRAVERSQVFADFTARPPAVAPSLLVETRETRLSESGVNLPAAETPEYGSQDILSRTAANTTPGFVPGIESRKPTTEGDGAIIGGSAPIEVRIHLPLKP